MIPIPFESPRLRTYVAWWGTYLLVVMLIFSGYQITLVLQPLPCQVPAFLQATSVLVKCPGKLDPWTGRVRSRSGSGTIFLSEVEGKSAAFILTAYHVIRDLRQVYRVIAPDGSETQQIRYEDLEVWQDIVKDGHHTGGIECKVKVISTCPSRDIALLRVIGDVPFEIGGKMYLGSSVPKVGNRIFHCGAPGGYRVGGTNTLTRGIISRVGCRWPTLYGGSFDFDQTDLAALGGSSGGMVCDANGHWIGMITIGLQADNFSWYVPVRSIHAWAKQTKVQWLFNKWRTRPSENDITCIPLEIN